MPESLEQRLVEFTRQLDRLPDVQEPPLTTLQILGRQQHEHAWQRLFFHFLSPSAAHGIESALLEFFLRSLADRSDIEFAFSRFDLEEIQVETEVVASNGGRPDAVIWSDNDWFICWELKVTASEGDSQTQDYVDAESFPTIGLTVEDIPEDSRYYLYLAPESASAPSADAFTHVSWEWVASAVGSFVAKSQGKYPAQTTAQLTDFTNTINRELTMTDYRENQQEKASLYFEYYNEIGEARQAFETQWTTFSDNWGVRLAAAIDPVSVVEVPKLPDDDIAIAFGDSHEPDDYWFLRQGQSDWAGLVKEGWYRRRDDLSPIYASAEGSDDIRLSFYHRLETNRDRAIRETELELQLWHGTDNGDTFMYAFRDLLADALNDSSITVPPEVELTGKRGNPLTATYDIPTGEYDDFFEAYIESLRSAFVHLAIENEAVIEAIDRSFEETLDELE